MKKHNPTSQSALNSHQSCFQTRRRLIFVSYFGGGRLSPLLRVTLISKKLSLLPSELVPAPIACLVRIMAFMSVTVFSSLEN